MTSVRVQREEGKWRVTTMAGNPIGPRLWWAVPPNGLPSVEDLFEDKAKAQDADLWNAYALWCQDRSGKRKRR
jgi:hypothetical protein